MTGQDARTAKWSLDQIVKQVHREHQHIRLQGGYVACTCHEDWATHALHVEEKVTEALMARLLAVAALRDEWRDESPRFGFRRAADYADDLSDVLYDVQVTP
jgi:hypothetical protein